MLCKSPKERLGIPADVLPNASEDLLIDSDSQWNAVHGLFVS